MRIFGMMVVVPVRMRRLVFVNMPMRILLHESAGARTKCSAKIAIFDIRSGRGRALAFHMVMVALLWQANFRFKSQYPSTVFAH